MVMDRTSDPKNAKRSMNVTVFGITRDSRLTHPRNALSKILCRKLGRVTAAKTGHSQNVPVAIVSTPWGITTAVSLVRWNAKLSMVVSWFGSVTVASDVQPEQKDCGISVTPAGISSVWRLAQLLNVPIPTDRSDVPRVAVVRLVHL
jgi:hypothetical protein